MRVVVFSLFFFSRRLPFSMRCCVCVVFSLSLTSSLSSFFLSFFLLLAGFAEGAWPRRRIETRRVGEKAFHFFLLYLFIYLFLSFFLYFFPPTSSSFLLLPLLWSFCSLFFSFSHGRGLLFRSSGFLLVFFSLPSLPSFFLHGSNEHRKHPGFMGFNWFTSKCFFVCQQLTGFDWVWLGFTGFYWVSLG